jgi:hypothetical protein
LIVEERLYMAVDTDDEKGAMFGPFKTAGEAEEQSRRLGWAWVLVYVNTVENGKVVDVKTRFYQIDSWPDWAEDPTSVESIRKKLVPVEIPPLSDADKKFFASLEVQMEKHYAANGRMPSGETPPRSPLDRFKTPRRGH